TEPGGAPPPRRTQDRPTRGRWTTVGQQPHLAGGDPGPPRCHGPAVVRPAADVVPGPAHTGAGRLPRAGDPPGARPARPRGADAVPGRADPSARAAAYRGVPGERGTTAAHRRAGRRRGAVAVARPARP